MWPCVRIWESWDRLLVLILAVSAIAAGQVLKVCKDGCEELPEGQTCSGEHEDFNYPPTAETVRNGEPASSCEECTECTGPTIVDSSLQLSTELQHYNQHNFSIAVTWALPETDVTGFTLILTDDAANGCRDLPPADALNPFNQCVSQLSPNTQQFNFTYRYTHSNHEVKRVLYVKLTAHLQNGNCATAEIPVPVPRNCHTLQPGNCRLCGQQPDFRRVPEVRNVTYTMTQTVDEGLWEAFISWDTSPPCQLCIFYMYFTFTQQPERTTLLKVAGGRTNVTLRNLEVQETYSVRVRPYQCQCGNFFRSPIKELFFDTASTEAPTTNMAPVSVTDTAAPRHTAQPVPSSPLTPTSSSPVDLPVTSAPSGTVDLPVTSAPSGTFDLDVTMSSQLTPSPGVTPGPLMVLYPGVGVGVAMLIAITVLTGIIVAVLVRRYAANCKATHSGPCDDSSSPPKPPPSDYKDEEIDMVTVQVVEHTFSPLPLPIEPIFPTPPPSPPNNTMHMLFVYSPATAEEQQLLARWLLYQLQNTYGITVHCSQMKSDRARLVEWVPRMARDCDAVVCVCNEPFYNEWEGAACNGSPVRFLREVVHGIVSADESEKLSKYAVVYVHQRHIPDYLLSCERHYLRSKTTAERIARFVLQEPEYQL